MTLAMVLALSVSKVLDPIVQNGDSTIHWTNFYPLDNLIGLPCLIHWIVIYFIY